MAKVGVAIITVSLISLAIGAWGRRPIPDSPPCDFPAIYNFGDSNSDTGAISAAFWPTPPPYGLNYFGKPSGRNSDGRLIIDFIAEHLGLPYLSPYLDSLGTNFRHGANFATAGSTICTHNESIFENGLSPFSLDIQTLQHHQFMTRTSELYNQGGDSALSSFFSSSLKFLKYLILHLFSAKNLVERSKLPVPEEFSRALYTFDIGQNDIASGFRKLTMPQFQDSIPDIVDRFGDFAAIVRARCQGILDSQYRADRMSTGSHYVFPKFRARFSDENLLRPSREQGSCLVRADGDDQRVRRNRRQLWMACDVRKLGRGPLFSGCQSMDR